jgi:hypothetical protein
VVPRRSGGVDRGAVCGLLMELLHDVKCSFCLPRRLAFFMVVFDLCVRSGQDASLTKVGKTKLSLKIMVMSFGGAWLC